MCLRDTAKRSATSPKIAPGSARGEGAGIDQDGEDAPAGRAQQVDHRVLEVPVQALDDRPVQVQDVHVEAEVNEAEMDERAGEDAPPLTIRHFAGVDEVVGTDRSEPVRQRFAPAQDRVDPEDGEADADDRVGNERHLRGIRAACAVELAASGKVVARLLEEPGDAIGNGTALLGGALRSASRYDSMAAGRSPSRTCCSAMLRQPSQLADPPLCAAAFQAAMAPSSSSRR